MTVTHIPTGEQLKLKTENIKKVSKRNGGGSWLVYRVGRSENIFPVQEEVYELTRFIPNYNAKYYAEV